MSPANGKPPVVFIHGLWLHPSSWEPWIAFFQKAGYAANAARWPGDGDTVEQARRNPAAVAGFGVKAIADHIAGQVKELGAKPVVIGHSFGGLLAQNLLTRDLAAAAVAIDPAPIQGVPELPFSALKSAFPVLGNPFNLNKAIALTEPQFRFGFTNMLPEDEAHTLFEQHTMPSPAKPLFQAASAALNPNSETKVDRAGSARGPLLLISGENDNTVPPVLVRSTQRAYGKSTAVTDFHSFAGRGHSLVIDHGWQELAEYALGWLNGKGY